MENVKYIICRIYDYENQENQEEQIFRPPISAQLVPEYEKQQKIGKNKNKNKK